jgi:hypothetical protein
MAPVWRKFQGQSKTGRGSQMRTRLPVGHNGTSTSNNSMDRNATDSLGMQAISFVMPVRMTSCTFPTAYSKINLENSAHKTSPYFRPLWVATLLQILIIGLGILLRVYQPIYVETSVRNKCRCSFYCALLTHYMLRPLLVAIFRWFVIQKIRRQLPHVSTDSTLSIL